MCVVPAIINGGYLHDRRRGTIWDGLVHITDLPATFVALAGANMTRDASEIDGFDISKIIIELRLHTYIIVDICLLFLLFFFCFWNIFLALVFVSP